MHQSEKERQRYFGMKTHIGADLDSGLVHRVIGTAGNVADVTQADCLLHNQEKSYWVTPVIRALRSEPRTKSEEPAGRWP